MKYIVGLKINLINTPEDFDKEYNDDTIEEFIFCIKNFETGEKEEVRIILQEGLCYSGYTSAQWIHSDIKIVETFGSIHYVPKEKFKLKYNYNFGIPIESNILYDAYINDDIYYPSANFSINFNSWTDTKRSKEQRPIWLFNGTSAIGKSFISSKLQDKDLKVVELENYEDLYIINYNVIDVVVIGNKNGITPDAVKTVIEDPELKFDKREIIKVSFEYI